MIAYLVANGLSDTATALRREVNIGEDVFDSNTAKKYEGMLEKKWTSIARLHKKVSELCILARYFQTSSALAYLIK